MSSEFYSAIPPAIRPLILERRILPSEDGKAHRDLLIELWQVYRPNTVMQWLDLKKLRDLIWEGLRLGRIKSEIVMAGRKRALSSLLVSMTNESECDFTSFGNMVQSEEQAISWFNEQRNKKKIKPLLDKFEFSEATIDAVAFQQHVDDHETLEKMQNWNEARQLAFRRQIAEEREILELQARAGNETGPVVRRRLPVGANTNEEEDQCQPVEREEDASQAEYVEDDHGDGDGAPGEAVGAEKCDGGHEVEQAAADEIATDEGGAVHGEPEGPAAEDDGGVGEEVRFEDKTDGSDEEQINVEAKHAGDEEDQEKAA